MTRGPCGPEPCSSACPASRPTATTSPPTAVEHGAAALVVERPLGLGVPEVQVARRAGRHGARGRRASTATPRARLDVVGVTGTNGKTTTAFLVRALLEADGRQTGLLGTVTLDRRRRGARRSCAPRPRRSTSSATSRRCSTAATWPARWRSPRTRSSCAAPTPSTSAVAIFTNLTQDHLDFHPTMEDYFAAKRRLFDGRPAGGGGQRRRPVRTPAGRGAARRAHLRDRSRDADYARRRRGLRPDRLALHAAPPRARELGTPLPGLFNVLNALGALAAARALGVADDTSVAALAGRRPRARPLRAGRRGAGLRRARRLRPHPRLARERPARRARSSPQRPACIVRLRRRRRPRPRQAPADGPSPRGAGRPRRS